MASPVDSVPERGMLSQVNAITLHSGGNAMTASINLTKMGVDANTIRGIFITHEHTDHINGLKVFAAKHNIPRWSGLVMLAAYAGYLVYLL